MGFARHLRSEDYAGIDEPNEAADDALSLELEPDDMGLHGEERGGRSLLRGLVRLLVLATLAGTLYAAETNFPGWRRTLIDTLAHLIDRPRPSGPASMQETSLAPPALPETHVVLEAAATPPESVAIENPAAAVAQAAGEAEPTVESEPPAEPPASENPKSAALDPQLDSLQKRAAAVGLSPELSRVLLARLSRADLLNAGIAVDRATAETPDGQSFVHPAKAKPGQVAFRVHFVAGAARNCRRYVVTVSKDGWSTTAPPMQKCGVRVARSRRD